MKPFCLILAHQLDLSR